jgi:tRNA_anti-like
VAKTCPSCGYGPIGPFTDNCPICAEPVRNVRSGGGGGWGGLSPVIRWLLIGGLVAGLGVAGCCGLGMWRMGVAIKDAQEQAERMRAEEEARRRERTVAVPAAQLLKEFQDDPAAADRKYKGKYLEVSGVVERVGRNRNEGHFVILHGGDKQAKLRVECFFFPAGDVEEGRIERLDEGQAVTVRGEYDGRVTNIRLSECELAK